MAQNDFLPFAIATGANVLDQDEYSELPAVSTGFQTGLASSKQMNKAIRQGTVMASVLAQFISDNTGSDVLDDGNTAPILALLNQAVGNISSAHIASASGSADAITATFSPAITLSNGMVVYVRAAYSNATTTPTINPDDLGALPIVKGSNLPLAVGDIGGAGYWMILQYDQAFNKWVLQNPATGIVSQDVSGKANVSLDNVTEDAGANLNSVGVRTVINADSSGTTWYRKWSDGWLEQGGFTSGNAAFALPLAYADTNYTVVVGRSGNTGAAYSGTGISKTTTSVTITDYDGTPKYFCCFGKGA